MAGKAAMGSGRAERERARYNGADGRRDMAGKAAMGSGRAERERARYKLALRKVSDCARRLELMGSATPSSPRLPDLR
jgi:hypothetical protein